MSKSVKTPIPATADEAIGRPAEWHEGRFQKQGVPVDQNVEPPAHSPAKHDKISTQVTKKDYESLDKPAAGTQTPTHRLT